MSGRKVKDDNTRPPLKPMVDDVWYDQGLSRVRQWNGKEWVDYKPGRFSGKAGDHE